MKLNELLNNSSSEPASALNKLESFTDGLFTLDYVNIFTIVFVVLTGIGFGLCIKSKNEFKKAMGFFIMVISLFAVLVTVSPAFQNYLIFQ